MALHSLESDPDVRLRVFDDMADVQWGIRVRQCAGNQDISMLAQLAALRGK